MDHQDNNEKYQDLRDALKEGKISAQQFRFKSYALGRSNKEIEEDIVLYRHADY